MKPMTISQEESIAFVALATHILCYAPLFLTDYSPVTLGVIQITTLAVFGILSVRANNRRWRKIFADIEEDMRKYIAQRSQTSAVSQGDQ